MLRIGRFNTKYANIFFVCMDMQLFFKKVYWHFFKTMPCEMILKTKWDEYRKVEKHYWDKTFDIESMKVDNLDLIPNKSIFVYWDKGFENAPVIVQKCYYQLLKHIPDGWNVVTLTSANTYQYLSMPIFLDKLLEQDKIYRAHYSDIIRTALLYHYGGIWIDSTCLLTKDIPMNIIDESFFMFTPRGLVPYLPITYENWFIRADKHNYVLGRVLENLLYYFKNCSKIKDIYFVWFYILSALNKHDDMVRDMLDKIPYCSNHDALLASVHYGLNTICNDKLWSQIKNKCFVQKLTYKYNKEYECNSQQNILMYILKMRD